MGRLTVKVEDSVLGRAREYADEHGTSVHQLVESFLDLLSRRPDAAVPALTGPARDVKSSAVGQPRQAKALRRLARNVIRFPATPPTRRG